MISNNKLQISKIYTTILELISPIPHDSIQTVTPFESRRLKRIVNEKKILVRHLSLNLSV